MNDYNSVGLFYLSFGAASAKNIAFHFSGGYRKNKNTFPSNCNVLKIQYAVKHSQSMQGTSKLPGFAVINLSELFLTQEGYR